MRPVTRLHFDGQVGTVQFAEVGIEDRSQAGSTWGRKWTTIGVRGCCRNSLAECQQLSSRVARDVEIGKQIWTDEIQQSQHARAGGPFGVLSRGFVLDRAERHSAVLRAKPLLFVACDPCCTIYNCHAVHRRSSAECYRGDASRRGADSSAMHRSRSTNIPQIPMRRIIGVVQ
jgi:hypothetical protein